MAVRRTGKRQATLAAAPALSLVRRLLCPHLASLHRQADRPGKVKVAARRVRASRQILDEEDRNVRRYSWKLIATVIMTGTATPLTRVGAYSHCLTASSAA